MEKLSLPWSATGDLFRFSSFFNFVSMVAYQTGQAPDRWTGRLRDENPAYFINKTGRRRKLG
jgi:hypothetical protein